MSISFEANQPSYIPEEDSWCDCGDIKGCADCIKVIAAAILASLIISAYIIGMPLAASLLITAGHPILGGLVIAGFLTISVIAMITRE